MVTINKYLEINPINPAYQRNKKSGKPLDKLANSIEKYGILTLPVCVKQLLHDGTIRYVLVDGLHRVEAARLANKLDELDVIVSPYVCQSNLEVVELMKTLNTTQSPWVLSTYVHFYASCNEGSWRDYRKMEELKKQTNIGYSILSTLLTGIRSRTCSIDIKTGKFEIRDAELSEKAINAFKQFKATWTSRVSGDIQRELAYIIYNYCETGIAFTCNAFWNYLKKGPQLYREIYAQLKVY